MYDIVDEFIKDMQEYYEKYKSSIIDGYMIRLFGSLYIQSEKGNGFMTIDEKKLNAERQERLNAFLKELGELTKKYKIEIGGCGCCGSPWLLDKEEYKEVENAGYDINYTITDSLSYEDDTSSYETDDVNTVITKRETIDWAEQYRPKK